MECKNRSEVRIHTIYGPVHICRQCADSHPIPANLKTIMPDINTPWRDEHKKCECEHISHFSETKVRIIHDSIIMIRDDKTNIITRDGNMRYSQNDTVLVIMNGKTEIVDKQSFREMLNSAIEDSPLADSLLNSLDGN